MRHAFACAFAAALSSGCATMGEQQMYMDWIAVANPATVCGGQSDCVQHSTWRGQKLCRIVTADKSVSYARLGEQVRECMRPAPSPAAEAEHRRE